jgi:hypothetical protein
MASQNGEPHGHKAHSGKCFCPGWKAECGFKRFPSRFDAVVLVFEADDVVFAEVAARLHFDDFQWDDSRVFEPVPYP